MARKTEHELIVVPLDGSEQAEQVIPYAEALRGRGGTLLFFQVVDPSGPARGLFGDIEITMEDLIQQEREAAKGRLTREKMHKLSVAAASERLRLDDALESVERRIDEHLGAADRKRARERDVSRLLDGWDGLRFDERQTALREAVSRITVRDDGVEIALRA